MKILEKVFYLNGENLRAINKMAKLSLAPACENVWNESMAHLDCRLQPRQGCLVRAEMLFKVRCGGAEKHNGAVVDLGPQRLEKGELVSAPHAARYLCGLEDCARASTRPGTCCAANTAVRRGVSGHRWMYVLTKTGAS